MSDDFKEGLRLLLEEHGVKVKFNDDSYFAGRHYKSVSVYGWEDGEAFFHFENGHCGWVVPEGTLVQEETYSRFAGTFTGHRDEVGLNAEGCRCKCGKYTDVTLRLTMTLGEAIRILLGYDSRRGIEL